jgi:hypothetical protein
VRIALVVLLFLAQAQEKKYRLPSTDLKQRVLWGSTLEVPDGPSLAFGGQDQKSDDGNPHTRIKVNGEWKAIHEELRANNPLQKFHDRCRALRDLQKNLLSKARTRFFEGDTADGEGENEIANGIVAILNDLPEGTPKKDLETARAAAAAASKGKGPALLREMASLQQVLEGAAESFDAEPAARALSPIVYDPATKLFVIFGGDHLDYLTNDTWVFDPEKRKWSMRRPKEAPAPRANHQLKASAGKVTLAGGYTYTSNTDYVGGQYRDHNDGEWVYDIAADTWSGSKPFPTDSRTYRTGRLHPDFYLDGPKPALVELNLPPNTWVKMNPPHYPALNRDWGTAVLDPDRDLILRWSGGHSAHGGTDVIQYHLKTNRWELCYPVEFPLGQLYTNTEYPEGVNFNRRPWVTGHTYQNYGYDPNLKKMLFTGRREDCHIYDPTVGDWTGKFAKPKPMVYGDCFYTLTLTPTPEGLVCWTHDGKLFRFEGKEWVEKPLTGAKLPGSVVDNSTVVYESKRERLLFARKAYGDKTPFTGELHEVSVKTWTAALVSPENKDAASGMPYLCQIRYDSVNDLLLVGGTLKPGDDGVRRTPAYDPAGNRWVSLKITGDDPNGKNGRNVSLGMMYDAKRKVFWAVDTNSQVYVLQLDLKSADLKPM